MLLHPFNECSVVFQGEKFKDRYSLIKLTARTEYLIFFFCAREYRKVGLFYAPTCFDVADKIWNFRKGYQRYRRRRNIMYPRVRGNCPLKFSPRREIVGTWKNTVKCNKNDDSVVVFHFYATFLGFGVGDERKEWNVLSLGNDDTLVRCTDKSRSRVKCFHFIVRV